MALELSRGELLSADCHVPSQETMRRFWALLVDDEELLERELGWDILDSGDASRRGVVLVGKGDGYQVMNASEASQ